ncbi:hypothetical protein MPQ_0294 [Methylovorus sp. MP688]|nr:hypothetical protein MPQ_0294 [Methylovorus sp. MP688]
MLSDKNDSETDGDSLCKNEPKFAHDLNEFFRKWIQKNEIE